MKRLCQDIIFLVKYSRQWTKHVWQLVWFGLILLLVAGISIGAAHTPQRAQNFIALGVYWAGEYTFNAAPDRWKRVDKALDNLAAQNVNSVWLTHLTSAETAEFARRAAQRNIYVVASLGELQGNVAEIRKGAHPPLIANTLLRWGNAPLPIAWGLGDEPVTEYMDEMAAYVKAWKTHAPGEPLTTVVEGAHIFSAAQAGFDILCTDIYPFYGPGLFSGYGGEPWANWIMNARNLVNQNLRPWMMPQAFQMVEGPYEVDPQGNIVYLPGSVKFWVMPTPAQIKWQAWSAIATGNKGVIYFTYYWPTESKPLAALPANRPFLVKEQTNSNAPLALVYDENRHTPQYEAMGETFGKIKQIDSVLASLQPTPGPEAWLTKNMEDSTFVNVLVNSQTNKRYLIVTAGYEGENTQNISLTLGPHITGLKSLLTGKILRLDVAAPFKKAIVSLPPGEAEVFECEIDKDNLPIVYRDDFTTDKFTQDSVNASKDGVRLFDSPFGNWLAAEDASSPRETPAFLIYDIDAMLGSLGDEGIRSLQYLGYIKPPQGHGVFWSVSADGKSYTPLSNNEFDRGIPFLERYLKVEFSQVPSNNPRHGYLKGLTFSQWKQSARVKPQ